MNGTNLGGGGNVRARQTNVRCPSNISDPICVTLESILLYPTLRVIAVRPDADDVVASSAREALHGAGWRPRRSARRSRGRTGGGLYKRAGRRRRGPGNGITANAVRVEDVGAPVAVVCEVMNGRGELEESSLAYF